jgi:hypothetical protein
MLLKQSAIPPLVEMAQTRPSNEVKILAKPAAMNER